jgi:hypothetical protein
MTKHPIRWLLRRRVRGRAGDPVTLKLRLAEEVCARRGHRVAVDTDGSRYCDRCWDTLPCD